MLRRSPSVGVLSLCAVILLGTALATIPTPLYPVYVREAGLDAVGITSTFAAFAAGAVVGLGVALLAAGRLTRRRAFTIAAALQAASAFVLAADLGIPGFAAGRVVTGMGAGLLAASGTAFVMELALVLRPRSARVVRAGAPALAFAGLGLGPLISASAAPTDLAGVRAVFLATGLAVFATLIVALLVLPVSAGRATAGATAGRRPPLPWASGLGAFGAFMTTGLFGSVTSVLLGDLGIHDAPRSGLFAAAVFVAGAAGVVALAPRVSLPIAGVWLAGGLVFVGAAVASSSPALLLVAAVVAGSAGGALFARSLRAAVAAAPGHVFAQTVAVFLCAYAGLAIPVLGFGFVARAVGTGAALWMFSGVGAGICLTAAASAIAASRASRMQAPGDSKERSLA
ncbi:hypothetical protein AB1K56_06880 [Microbacterium sp. BWR-S6Y]|uniref:hypothetical protein n=1 Tax=Microbacterium sp. BWR-S6Y TaxID=3232073 RepID=UPI003528CA52